MKSPTPPTTLTFLTYPNLKKKAGYEYLLAYKITVPIYDYTVVFCKYCSPYIKKFPPPSTPSLPPLSPFPELSSPRTHDQMVQAARSGTTNIAEGNRQKSLEGYIKLLGVNKASLEELLKDFLSYARQNGIEVWDKDRVVREIGQLGEVWGILNGSPTLPNLPNFPNLPTNPTKAVNLMITLINQAIYLQSKLLDSLEKKFIEQGGFRENLFKRRMEFRKVKRDKYEL